MRVWLLNTKSFYHGLSLKGYKIVKQQPSCSKRRFNALVSFSFIMYPCSFYNSMWNEAQRSINDLMTIEQPPEPPKPEKVRTIHLLIMYYTIIGLH